MSGRVRDLSDDDDAEGVSFIFEEDGRVTAIDATTGVASFGDTKAEALRQLADAIDAHERAQRELGDEEIDPANAPWT